MRPRGRTQRFNPQRINFLSSFPCLSSYHRYKVATRPPYVVRLIPCCFTGAFRVIVITSIWYPTTLLVRLYPSFGALLPAVRLHSSCLYFAFTLPSSKF